MKKSITYFIVLISLLSYRFAQSDYTTDSYGGGGGDIIQNAVCKNGYVTTIKTNAGIVVDSLQIICSDGEQPPRIGGGGGGAKPDIQCDQGFKGIKAWQARADWKGYGITALGAIQPIAQDQKCKTQKNGDGNQNPKNISCKGNNRIKGFVIRKGDYDVVETISVVCEGGSSMLCNGKEELCDRPYNKMVQVNVHNATTTTKKGIIIPNLVPCTKGGTIAFCDYDTHFSPVADQNWDLQEDLNHGLRYFKLPIHPRSSKDNTPWVAHTMRLEDIAAIADKITAFTPSTFGIHDKAKNWVLGELSKDLIGIDTTNVRFLDVLNQLKKFLDEHPHEVITLELNTFLPPDQDNKSEMNNNLVENFKQSGIDKYVYVPKTWPRVEGWPTLREMIKANQRLVVISDDPIYEPDTKNIIPGFFVQNDEYVTRNGFGYGSKDELLADDCSNVKKDPNLLFNMTHNITGKVAGTPQLAATANSYDILDQHVQKCIGKSGRYPNFISLDYVDVKSDDIQRFIDDTNEAIVFCPDAIQQIISSKNSDGSLKIPDLIGDYQFNTTSGKYIYYSQCDGGSTFQKGKGCLATCPAGKTLTKVKTFTCGPFDEKGNHVTSDYANIAIFDYWMCK